MPSSPSGQYFDKDLSWAIWNCGVVARRLFIYNRGFDTTITQVGEIELVPLYTLIPFDSMKSNAQLDIRYKKGAKITTTYDIKKGGQIIKSSGLENKIVLII